MREKDRLRFADRREAGCELARRIWARLWWEPAGQDVLVLGASPGGIMVAAPVAAALDAELDVVAVCPITSPERFSHNVGAVTATGPRVLAGRSLDRKRSSTAAIGAAVAAARRQARTRELAMRGNTPPSMIAGRSVIVVDDGLGIGVNALAVLRHVRRRRPARLWFATPVAAEACVPALAALADELISVTTPPGFVMAGSFYARLKAVSAGEVRRLLSARPTNRFHTANDRPGARAVDRDLVDGPIRT